MLKVLISNDDGIHANGIQTLAEKLSQTCEVYVVAPDRERSATGHALTLHKPIRIEEVSLNFPVAQAYAVSGTPSDCVKLAINALFRDIKFDVVLSGINHGPNLGSDVLYSGTVSAALEGAIQGVPSIAVSLVNGFEKLADFSHGATFIANFLPRIMEVGIPARSILNINIPAVSLHHMAGVKVTDLGTRMYTDTYERRVDPRGGVYFWLAGEVVDTTEAESTDVEAIRNNMVSISPVHYNLTNFSVLPQLQAQLDRNGQLSTL
ncbi:MAG TPA: 5'/3'-nucleotidase SurE [Oculatellaceae cyanobacterium]|jgi:5'-nucleotidase